MSEYKPDNFACPVCDRTQPTRLKLASHLKNYHAWSEHAAGLAALDAESVHATDDRTMTFGDSVVVLNRGGCRFCDERSCYCCPECGKNVLVGHDPGCTLDPARQAIGGAK